MADFRPETTVYLFKATGVDDENQPFFTSEGEKLAWYQSHTYKVFNEYSYQRENREFIRVEGKAEQLREYDMMCFRNSENRYIFCRVEEVEFINPNTADIYYSIDYMQTYVDVCDFGECWVEREMVENDWNGEIPSWNNVEPEGIETGRLTRTLDKVASYNTEAEDFNIIVVSAYDINGEPNYEVKTTNFYPSGLNAILFASVRFGAIGALNQMLKTYADKGIDVSKAILGIYVAPKMYMGETSIGSKPVDIENPFPTIDGYTVINSKCFTSEFFRLEISNRRGATQELRPEIFWKGRSTNSLRMQWGYNAGVGGTMLFPSNYEGLNYDYGVIRYDDVQAPFTSNGFAAWLSGNFNTLSTEALGNAIQGAGPGLFVSTIPGMQGVGLAMAAQGAMQGAGRSIAKIQDRSKDPVDVGGQSSGHALEIMMDNYGFSINWLHPLAPVVKTIDEYFGRFGYKTNRFKKPNVDTRPKWNYVKTAGAICRGPFGKKAQVYMQNLMDNGVTFWHLYGGENITDDWDILVNKEG